MKILLVYPKYPDTFWSFKHALWYVSKKAAFPPLGLLTLASLFPPDWERKLIDMNIRKLKDRDILWADYVFISAMIVQRPSAEDVIRRCKELGVKVVVGGPLFTSRPEEFSNVDHRVLGEAEVTFPKFLADLKKGSPKPLYEPDHRPAMSESPIPQWNLLQKRHYVSMAVQFSRGCPFNCEFCDIIIMSGRVPRLKSPNQLLRELDALYQWGWRGALFMVDDNFIGNKAKVKIMLRQLIEWQKKHRHPFSFFTEASLNLAEDEEMMTLMIEAGFNKVFIGLETPEEASLSECSKLQNTGRDQVALVKKIQNFGFEVLGGFIIGFDSDTPSVFDNQIKFIQNMGVVTAMVGLLNALPGTRLYKRLKGEGRLLKDSTGDNSDCSINFIPKMETETLMLGYQRVLNSIYSTKGYYERIYKFLEEYRPQRFQLPTLNDLTAFLKSIWVLGIFSRSRWHYWKLITRSIFKYPRSFHMAVTLAILGRHFQKVSRKYQVEWKNCKIDEVT